MQIQVSAVSKKCKFIMHFRLQSSHIKIHSLTLYMFIHVDVHDDSFCNLTSHTTHR